LEITLNESFKGDIQARLGRSDHKDVNKLKENRNNKNNSLSANLSKNESLHNSYSHYIRLYEGQTIRPLIIINTPQLPVASYLHSLKRR